MLSNLNFRSSQLDGLFSKLAVCHKFERQSTTLRIKMLIKKHDYKNMEKF